MGTLQNVKQQSDVRSVCLEGYCHCGCTQWIRETRWPDRLESYVHASPQLRWIGETRWPDRLLSSSGLESYMHASPELLPPYFLGPSPTSLTRLTTWLECNWLSSSCMHSFPLSMQSRSPLVSSSFVCLHPISQHHVHACSENTALHQSVTLHWVLLSILHPSLILINPVKTDTMINILHLRKLSFKEVESFAQDYIMQTAELSFFYLRTFQFKVLEGARRGSKIYWSSKRNL